MKTNNYTIKNFVMTFRRVNVLVITTMLLLVNIIALAQVPQFYNNAGGAGSNTYPLGQTVGQVVQWGVAPGGFNLPSAAPAGNNITALWLYVPSACNANYSSFKIRLAQVSSLADPLWTAAAFYSSMTTVFGPSSINITASAGTWTSLTLNTPFLYDPSMALLVEVSQCGYTGTGINVFTFSAASPSRKFDATPNCVLGAESQDALLSPIGLTLVPSGPCTDPPTPGTATASASSVCASSAVSLNLTGASLGIGQTYQWKSDPSSGGSFSTNVGGLLTSPFLTINPTSALFYRCAVTCGTTTLNSTAVQVTVIPGFPGGTYTIDNTIPTGGTNFQSFTAAVNAMLTCGVSGSVVFNVTAGQTFNENVPLITVNSDNLRTIIFQRSGFGANPVIVPTGSTLTTDAGIAINGSDFITFNGIDITASGTAVETGYRIIQQSATNGAQNNTIKNCTITLNRTNTNSRGIFQTATLTPTSAAGANSNNVYQNLTIKNVYAGIQLTGIQVATFPDRNNVINTSGCGTNNIIGDPLTSFDIGGGITAIQTWGIRLTNQAGFTVSNNIVNNVSGNTTTDGILIETYIGIAGSLVSTLSNNVVKSVRINASVSTQVNGIRLSHTTLVVPAGTVLRVFNNAVSGITSAYAGAALTLATTTGIKGIVISGTGGSTINQTYEIYNNSVSLDGSGSLNLSNACFQITSTAGLGPINIVRNNIFSNFTGAQGITSKHAGVFTASLGSATAMGPAGSSVANNDVFINADAGISGFVGMGSTTGYNPVATWQTTYTQATANQSLAPLFLNNITDLHANNGALDALGFAYPAYLTIDLDCATRTGTPDMGAYLITPCTGVPSAGTVTATPSSICPGGSSLLTATGFSTGVTFQWESSAVTGGPYSPIGGANSPTFNTGPLLSNTYYRLTVTCVLSSLPSSSSEVAVSIIAAPSASITPAGPISGCQGTITPLSASTNAVSPIYQWKRDGVNIPGATNSTYTPVLTGVHTVSITDIASPASCPGLSAGVTVTVLPVPAITVSATNASICFGSSTTLSAVQGGAPVIFSDSYIANTAPTLAQCNAYAAFRASLQPLTYTQLKLSGSLDPIGKTAINPAVVQAIANAMKNNTALLNMIDGANAWGVGVCGAGCGAAQSNELTVVPGAASSNCACNTVGAITIRPEINNLNWGGVNGLTCAAPSQTLTVMFTGQGPLPNYSWSPATGLSCTNCPSPIASPTVTTTYTVTTTNPNGCTGTGTITINLIPSPPSPTASAANQVCGFGTVTLNATGTGNPGTSLRWYSAPSGGSILATGGTFTTPEIGTTTTFYVAEFDGTCEGIRTGVNAVSITPTPVVVTNSIPAICNGVNTPSTLTASSSNSNYVYQWTPTTGLTPGSGLGASVQAFPSSTVNYLLTATDNTVSPACVVKINTTVGIGQTPVMSSISATPSAVCTGEPSALNALAIFEGFPTTQNGFQGFFAPLSWTTQHSTGDLGTVNIFNSTTLQMTSSDGGSGATDIDVIHNITANGNVTFSWDYNTPDGPAFDQPQYYKNGVRTNVPGFNTAGTVSQSGTASIPVVVGDIFGFSMHSVDNIVGGATSNFTNVVFPLPAGTGVIAYSWTPAATLNTSTGATVLATPLVGGTQVYTVTASNEGCNVTATVTLNATLTPPAPVATGTSVCGQGMATVSATGTGGTLLWTDGTGGKIIGTGTSYSEYISATKQFMVRENPGGVNQNVGLMANAPGVVAYASASFNYQTFNVLSAHGIIINTVDVVPNFATPLGTPIEIVLENNLGVQIGPALSFVTTTQGSVQTLTLNMFVPQGNIYRLRASKNPNLQYHQSGFVNPYTIPGQVSITGWDGGATLYVFFYHWNVTTACLGASSTATALVTPAPPLTVTPPSGAYCNSGSVALTAGGPSYVNFSWSPSAGLSSTTGASVTASPSVTTSYIVMANDGLPGGCVDSQTVVINVNTGPNLAITQTAPYPTVCLGYSFPLNAVGSSNSFKQFGSSHLSANNQAAVLYNGGNASVRSQVLYTAAELNAAGLVPGNISAIGWEVATKLSTGTYSNFTIKMANVPDVALTLNYLNPTFTTVFNGSVVTSLGWNVHNFTTPFAWNGTSSILVDVCNGTGPPFGFDQVYTSATSATLTINITTLGCTSVSGAAVAFRPNTRLYGGGVNYSWAPAVDLSSTTISNPVYTSTSTGVKTYTVTATDPANLCTSTAVTTWEVSTTPRPAIAVATGDAIFCFSGVPQMAITNTTGSYQWESSTDGINFNPVGSATGSTFTAATISSTSYYRVSVQCSGPVVYSNVLQFTVNNPAVASTTPSTPICGFGNVCMSATANNPSYDIKWYAAPSGGTSLFTGNTFCPTINATTTFYAEASTVGSQIVSQTPLTTTFVGGNGFNGNMFDITAINSVRIDSFAMNINGPATGIGEIWYRAGSWVGFNTSNAGWTLAGTAPYTSLVTGAPGTIIPVFINVVVPAGQTYAFYVHASTSNTYTNGTLAGNIFSSDANIQFKEGAGGGYFTVTNIPRVFNGRIFYSLGGGACTSPRVPVLAVSNPAPPITVTPPQNMCFGFGTTISASSLNSGYTYLWNPGSLSGASQSVNPPANTTYTVVASDNSAGPNNGCNISASTTITVKPVPNITSIGNNSPICAGGTLNLTSSSNLSSSGGNFFNIIPSGTTNIFPFNTGPKTIQWFVAPGEFINPTAAPAGLISTLGFYAANASAGATYTNLTVKLGQLSSPFAGGSLYTGPMTTVLGPATTTITATANATFNLTLTTPFTYNPSQWLVVEVSQCGLSGVGISLIQSTLAGVRRTYNDNGASCMPINFIGNDGAMAGITIGMIASAGYNWIGPNSFVSSVQNPSISSVTAAATGNYTVIVTDGTNGCTTTATTSVLIHTPSQIVSLQSATLNGGVATVFPAPPTFLDIPVFTTALTCDKVVSYNVGITGIPAPSLNYTFTGATVGSGSGTGTGSTFGRLIPTGRTTITVAASNVCGNQSKTFRVTVTDNVPPVITPIQVAPSNTNGGECASTVQVTQPSIGNGLFDNCPNSSLVFVSRSDGRSQFEPYYAGTTTVTWQATDASANTSSATQNVVVNNIKPIITNFVSSSGNLIFVNQTTTFTVTFTDEDGGGTHTVKFYRDKNDASPANTKVIAPNCTQSCAGVRSYNVTSDPVLYTISEVAEPKVEVLDGCNLAADQEPGVSTLQYLAIAVAGTQFTTEGGHYTMPAGGYPSSYEGFDVSMGDVVKPASSGPSFKGQLEMNVHIPNAPDWRVHTDNGTNTDITWDYLTISGCSLATFKGAVRLNGVTGYKVLVQQSDKTRNPATSNFIRVKVTTNAGAVVFDTQPGLTEALTSGNGGASAIIAALSSGTIKVQPSNSSSCTQRIEGSVENGLSQNIPNPFNGETEIRFSVPEDGLYILKVYNYLGQEVTTLFNEEAATGTVYSVTFDGSSMQDGIYTYTLTGAGMNETRRMNVIK